MSGGGTTGDMFSVYAMNGVTKYLLHRTASLYIPTIRMLNTECKSIVIYDSMKKHSFNRQKRFALQQEHQ